VLRRRPFLLEIRDLWPEFAIDIGVLTNPRLIAMARWLERFLYARADHLLVNSPAYRDYLIEHGVPAAKVSLIANGADPEMFHPDKTGAEFRGRWNLDGKFVVTYAGAMGLANDIPTILRAARRLKEDDAVHFVLAGDGKERQNNQRLAEELELTNVTYVGTVAKEKMAELLAASDACVATLKDIPMFRTTYPNKVFDYMAAGRPIVLGIDGVIRQVVENAGGGIFVPPGNDEKLAAAVLRLKDDPQAARQMGREGREHVVEYFNREHQAQEFVLLIERLARGESEPVTASVG
jgi:glycosyltransferase involved in cell wall biosynthesis